jgi:L-2-hydroxyglutarate oxidase LhgO
MDAEIAVVGAGVVGLACAARLAQAGHTVYLLERHGRIGQETSSRNSEVIHAGLYYPKGSLKALTCVEGRQRLLAWATARGVALRMVGKVVVATSQAQLPALEALLRKGLANDAGALRVLDAAEVHALEPRVRAVAGLWSPESGILDSHGFMESLRKEALDHGAVVAHNTELERVESGERLTLHTRDARGEHAVLEVDWLVNSAGLRADHVAALTGVDVTARELRLYPCRGDYFALSPRLRGAVSHLVYPMPEAAGLGIHLTMDLSGALRAGPDTTYVDAPDYEVGAHKASAFAEAIRRYLPDVDDDDLSPAYAGVRPKLQGPGHAVRDFVCEVYPEAPRVVQLVGIESPGLTAALALAERVFQRIRQA